MIPAPTWIDVRGGRLPIYADGDGTPLLLLHGWPLDTRMFQPQWDAFARTHRVIAMDRRGFGLATAPSNLHEELQDIDRVIEALELEQVHLLGVSQGARIALRYAITRSDRVASLILQGAVVDGIRVPESDAERIPLDQYAQLARDGRIADVRQLWLDHPMMRLGEDRAREHKLLRRILDDYHGHDLIHYEPGAYRIAMDMEAALSTLQVPVLLLTGENETDARKAHADMLIKHLPQCTEIVLSPGGHLSNLINSRDYNSAVIHFCRQSEAVFQ